MNRGLHGLHLALRIKNYYYSPSQFAIAWVAVQNKKKLEGILNHEKNKIRSNNYLSEKTPLFAEILKNHDEQHKDFSIETLEEIARKSYGTSKIIRNTGAIFTDKNGKTENISIRENVFAKVDTRRKRTAKSSYYNVSLFNVFLNDLENEINYFSFKGGTLHGFYRSDELSYWSKGIKREKEHLESIEKNFGKDVLKPYLEHVDIVDSAVAQTLIKINNELKKTDSIIDKSILEQKKDSVLPFDFEKSPELALETFLRINYSIRSRNKDITRHKRYFYTDIFLFNNVEEIIREDYLKLRKKGKATFEVFISGKYLPKNDISWAILQAFENHMYRKGRVFFGYTLEKIGNEYFIAVGFKNTKNSERQTSVRLICDDLFYPVALYKTITQDDLKTGTTLHPMKLLNFSKPRNKYDIIWRDIDLKSGRKTINELFEPLPEIIEEASELLIRNNALIDGYEFKNDNILKNYILEKYISKRKEYK